MGADILFPDYYCRGQISAIPMYTCRKKSMVKVPDYRRCECIHHLASKKIPCENIPLTKLFETKLTAVHLV